MDVALVTNWTPRQTQHTFKTKRGFNHNVLERYRKAEVEGSEKAQKNNLLLPVRKMGRSVHTPGIHWRNLSWPPVQVGVGDTTGWTAGGQREAG